MIPADYFPFRRGETSATYRSIGLCAGAATIGLISQLVRSTPLPLGMPNQFESHERHALLPVRNRHPVHDVDAVIHNPRIFSDFRLSLTRRSKSEIPAHCHADPPRNTRDSKKRRRPALSSKPKFEAVWSAPSMPNEIRPRDWKDGCVVVLALREFIAWGMPVSPGDRIRVSALRAVELLEANDAELISEPRGGSVTVDMGSSAIQMLVARCSFAWISEP